MDTDSENEKVTVGAKVEPGKKRRLEEIAYERSTPQDRLTTSDLLRELITEFVDENDSDSSEGEERAELEA